ncbi:MAG: hypothetical protein AAB461_01800 [Patescibacteria group bacterium]
MENNDLCYFVQYRTPHFSLLEPNKDFLQVYMISRSEAMRLKAGWPEEQITSEPIIYIAPMGKYIDLPLILEVLPEDFRTPEEFWNQKRYWN